MVVVVVVVEVVVVVVVDEKKEGKKYVRSQLPDAHSLRANRDCPVYISGQIRVVSKCNSHDSSMQTVP